MRGFGPSFDPGEDREITGKKTPGGAGTHTGHTGHTGARGHGYSTAMNTVPVRTDYVRYHTTLPQSTRADPLEPQSEPPTVEI